MREWMEGNAVDAAREEEDQYYRQEGSQRIVRERVDEDFEDGHGREVLKSN